MLVFILILLLVAAAFGVLGAVLKIAFALLLGSILAVTLAVCATWYYLRYRSRAWQHAIYQRQQEEDRRRRAIDVRHVRNEADRAGAERPTHELERGDAPTGRPGRPPDA